MPFSEFSKLFKAASTLDARRALRDIRIASFSTMNETDRRKFFRDLKTASTEHVVQHLKDFRDVVGNIAKRLMNG